MSKSDVIEGQQGSLDDIRVLLRELISETRAMRLAVVSMACNGGQANPPDFDPQTTVFDSDSENQG